MKGKNAAAYMINHFVRYLSAICDSVEYYLDRYWEKRKYFRKLIKTIKTIYMVLTYICCVCLTKNYFGRISIFDYQSLVF